MGRGDDAPTRYLIIAGTKRHADEVAIMRRIPWPNWRFVSEPHQLYGIHGPGYTILVYETWHSLPAHKHELIRQLVKRANQCGANVEHVYERDIR